MTKVEFLAAFPWMMATGFSLALAASFYSMARNSMDNFDRLRDIVDRLLAEEPTDEDEEDES